MRPSGLSTWGPYWQPKWAGEVGPRRTRYIRIWAAHLGRTSSARKKHRAHLGCRRGAHIGIPNGLGRWNLEGAYIYGSVGCPLGADIERADKITEPIWAVDVGPILAAQMGWGGGTWKEPIYTDRWAAHF